jgi:hypothetical protein
MQLIVVVYRKKARRANRNRNRNISFARYNKNLLLPGPCLGVEFARIAMPQDLVRILGT